MAAYFLGAQQAAFVEVVADGDQFDRHRGDAHRLRPCRLGFGLAPGGGKQVRLRAPARLEHRVEPARASVSNKGGIAVPLRPGEMPDSCQARPYSGEAACKRGKVCLASSKRER